MSHKLTASPAAVARRVSVSHRPGARRTDATPALAQSARDATLHVTVADQTGAIIVNASVTVQPIDPAGPPVEIMTDERGEATITTLLTGTLLACAPSFPGSSRARSTTCGCGLAAARGAK